MINKNTLIISALIFCYGAACYVAGKHSEKGKAEPVINAQEGYSKLLEIQAKDHYKKIEDLSKKNEELENENAQLRSYLGISKNYGFQSAEGSYVQDGTEDDDLSPYIISDESERTSLMDTEGVDYQDIHVYSPEVFAQENGDVVPDPIEWFGKENLDKFFDEVKKTGDGDMLIFSPIDATIYELLWDGVNPDDTHWKMTGE